MFATTVEEHAVSTAFALPTAAFPAVTSAASQLGINVLALLAFLWGHPDVIAQIIKDVTAGDLVKIVADIVTAWKASHP